MYFYLVKPLINIEKKIANTDTEHEKFIQFIYGKCEKTMPILKKVEKINDDDIILPTFNNYESILNYNISAKNHRINCARVSLKVSEEEVVL